MSKDVINDSQKILENFVLALVASLLYMIALVGYVKGTLGLTLDVHHELVISLWAFIILILFIMLEKYDRRGFLWYVRRAFK